MIKLVSLLKRYMWYDDSKTAQNTNTSYRFVLHKGDSVFDIDTISSQIMCEDAFGIEEHLEANIWMASHLIHVAIAMFFASCSSVVIWLYTRKYSPCVIVRFGQQEQSVGKRDNQQRASNTLCGCSIDARLVLLPFFGNYLYCGCEFRICLEYACGRRRPSRKGRTGHLSQCAFRWSSAWASRTTQFQIRDESFGHVIIRCWWPIRSMIDCKLMDKPTIHHLLLADWPFADMECAMIIVCGWVLWSVWFSP